MADVEGVALRVVAEDWAERVPSPAHDALAPSARRSYLADNPHSYLGVTRGPEDLPPGHALTNEELLQEGRKALDSLLDLGAFGAIHDKQFYLYQLETTDHVQTAIVGNVATQNFADGNVRLHELVQLDRATHLSRHLSVVAAQSSPIALAYRESEELDMLIGSVLESASPALVFSQGDGLTQRVWPVTDQETVAQLTSCLKAVTLYLIDGHHRAAAARAHQQAVGDEPSDTILSAIFGASQLRNRAHHRVLALGDQTQSFLERLQELLEVRVVDTQADSEARNVDEIALWHADRCYLVTVPFASPQVSESVSASVSARLDDLDPVRLQRGIIGPLLGVDGSWSGDQLTYRPGVHPVEELRRNSSDAEEVLCVMRPVEIQDLLDASDEGLVMPPKSTYFEPKARSGVFVRHLG